MHTKNYTSPVLDSFLDGVYLSCLRFLNMNTQEFLLSIVNDMNTITSSQLPSIRVLRIDQLLARKIGSPTNALEQSGIDTVDLNGVVVRSNIAAHQSKQSSRSITAFESDVAVPTSHGIQFCSDITQLQSCPLIEMINHIRINCIRINGVAHGYIFLTVDEDDLNNSELKKRPRNVERSGHVINFFIDKKNNVYFIDSQKIDPTQQVFQSLAGYEYFAKRVFYNQTFPTASRCRKQFKALHENDNLSFSSISSSNSVNENHRSMKPLFTFTSSSAQHDPLTEVCQLAEDPKQHKTIRKSGGILTLISSLKSVIPELRLKAISAILQLAKLKINRQAICKDGGIRPLVALLTDTNQDVRKKALKTLIQFASYHSSNDNTNQNAIFDAGAEPHIIALVNNVDLELKNSALEAIYALSSSNWRIQASFCSAGIIDYLFNILMMPEPVLVKNVLRLIRLFCSQFKMEQLDKEVISGLMRLLKRSSSEIGNQIIEILWVFCRGNTANQLLVIEHGGLSLLHKHHMSACFSGELLSWCMDSATQVVRTVQNERVRNMNNQVLPPQFLDLGFPQIRLDLVPPIVGDAVGPVAANAVPTHTGIPVPPPRPRSRFFQQLNLQTNSPVQISSLPATDFDASPKSSNS